LASHAGASSRATRVVSAETFQKLDNLICLRLFKWAKRRHPHKNTKWKANKYWQTIGGNKWEFAYKKEDKIVSVLLRHSKTPIKRHIKVKGEKSPYDGNLIYWSSRLGKNPEMPQRLSNLLKRQKGKCNQCKLLFKNEDILEVDHIVPHILGEKDEYKNLQVLHRHCHHKKTTRDGSHKKYSCKGSNH
jgi:RNA-directed DNA polymerase